MLFIETKTEMKKSFLLEASPKMKIFVLENDLLTDWSEFVCKCFFVSRTVFVKV